ncbi:conserved Plasmodium protein, unknown function [Plasmodium gallinaceum]|uniref:Uncharacterized protein n=1 Tax=Plasmodium gallinaceum TaxID=5849 RepID=A0A1J1GMP7_PLAGA|nr:conserved Plasmodium protein, unknown function [Plasmodium gallinaceum]CRG93533.1 conserved Plasmodium protein, unknown function [Plasmodium gallinaceum]
MLLVIRRNIKIFNIPKYDSEKIFKNLFLFKRKISNDINTSTQLIVKCVNEAYKSKSFSKMKWNCLSNDILKNMSNFNIKEILSIINILSHMHFGRNILIQFKSLIISKLSDLKANYILKILISYIKSNIKDDHFYNLLCLKLHNNLNTISQSSLINFLYNVNFNSNVKCDHLSNIEEQILIYLTKEFYTYNIDNKNINIECKENKNTDINESLKINEIVKKNIPEECINSNKKTLYNTKEKDETINNLKCLHLENYNFILLFYAFSHYLFNLYLKNKNNPINDNFVNQLNKYYDIIKNIINHKSKLTLLKEINSFHIFLLYKACLNTIYTFGDNSINKTLLDNIKENINNFILPLKNNNKHIKGQTNEMIRYMDILKQNLILYSENRKVHFQHYLNNNVMLIKIILSILQEKNKNDIKKYYIWHRKKVENIQKILRSIEID